MTTMLYRTFGFPQRQGKHYLIPVDITNASNLPSMEHFLTHCKGVHWRRHYQVDHDDFVPEDILYVVKDILWFRDSKDAIQAKLTLTF